jgi:hypothetical protein
VGHNLVSWLHAIVNGKDAAIGKSFDDVIQLFRWVNTTLVSKHIILTTSLPFPFLYFQVWYFLRIFVVFYGIWLPGMGLLVAGAAKQYEYANLICIGYLFCGIQPIVSTCMAMSKSDVRQYTLDVITLSYFRK